MPRKRTQLSRQSANAKRLRLLRRNKTAGFVAIKEEGGVNIKAELDLEFDDSVPEQGFVAVKVEGDVNIKADPEFDDSVPEPGFVAIKVAGDVHVKTELDPEFDDSVPEQEVESESEKFSDQEVVDPLAIKEDISWSVEGSEICHQCGYSSKTKDEMESHFLSFHSERHKQNKLALNDDMKESSAGDRHKCPHCDYCTAETGHLRSHIQRWHKTKRLYNCSECDYTCVRVSHLKRHILNKHTMERPHKCPHCDYCTVENSHLKSHIKSKHTLERPHKCAQCDYCCVKGSDLMRHVQNKHTTMRPRQCPECDYCCVQGSDLKRHIQSRHKAR